MNKHLTETEFYHKSHIEILSNHFLENDWVWLYKKYYESSDGVERYHKYVSYLATPISAAFSLKTPNTDIQDDVRVALMGDYTYRPFAKPGFENLVTVRDFKVSRMINGVRNTTKNGLTLWNISAPLICVKPKSILITLKST